MSAFQKHKITALICAATGLLATANNLDGEHPQFQGFHVTGYFEVAGLLKYVGKVNYDSGKKDKPNVIVDGNLITGRDPSSAQLFGQTVADAVVKLKSAK